MFGKGKFDMAELQKEVPPNAPDEKTAKEALAVPAAAKPVITRPEHCCVSTYWAVIERNGTIVRGRNVVSAQKVLNHAGWYEVIFTADVSKGVYQATIGRPGIGTETTGEICVAARYGNANGVWIDTHDSAGDYSDRSFHVMAFTD
jgi:hypothetical protein